MLLAFFLLIIDLLFSVSGQLLLKKGVSTLGDFVFSRTGIIDFFFGAVKSWYIWAAIACYGAAFLMWLIVLSKLKLSVAYPFTALVYVMIMIGSWWFFDERIGTIQIAGTVLIIAGLVVLSRAV